MIYSYIAPLLLTILIELFVLTLLGEKNKKILVSSLIVNILTNPVVNYLNIIFGSLMVLFILEIIVVVVEMFWYRILGKSLNDALIYSALCNAVSYFSGNVIYFVFFYCFR